MTSTSERRRRPVVASSPKSPLSCRFLLLSLALAMCILVDAAKGFGLKSGPFRKKISNRIAKITGLPSSTANANNQQQQQQESQPLSPFPHMHDDDEEEAHDLMFKLKDDLDEDEDDEEEHKEVRKKRKGRRRRIKKNERVVFFPTAAHRSDDGTGWDVPIHGWIYEPVTRDPARRAFVTSLRKYLKLKRDDEETLILKRRVGPFLVDNERRKELSILIGCNAIDNEDHDYCRVFELPRSGKNGHFEAVISISDEELDTVCTCDHHKETMDNNGVMSDCYGGEGSAILKYQAVTEDEDDRSFKGVSHLIPPTGISVISDIDDTVKITGVGSKKALLRSTFMEEFKEVPGMAQLYQQWAVDLDAKFHFVSSSPWQLWEELAQFFDKVGFPDATFHLKPVRLKDRTLFDLWKCPIETKTSVLESILDAFPGRKFMLVGDSGEKDPEVYGEIARRYPKQVQGIFIRNVTNETGTEERFDLAFNGVDRSVWTLFNEPQEITRLPTPVTPEL